MTIEDKKVPTEIAEAQLDDIEGGGVVDPPNWGIDRIDQNPSMGGPEILSGDASTQTARDGTDKRGFSSPTAMSWDNVKN